MSMGPNGARRKHTREDLIKAIKTHLGSSDQPFIRVCRDGLEDALAELEKPVLPNDAFGKINDVLVMYDGLGNNAMALRIVDALKPKPKTKTVWRVRWGSNGESLRCEDFETVQRALIKLADTPEITIVKEQEPA